MRRLLLSAALVALLAALLGLLAWPGGGRPNPAPPTAADACESLRRYGFSLAECARACGLDFRHQRPMLDPQLAHIQPLVASMNAGVSVVDFDGDSWLDLYVVTSSTGGQNRLYRNKGDGTFEDVAAALGVADLNRPGTGVCNGSVWADFDNDGFPDLFVYKWGRPELFRNQGGQGFERLTETSGLPAWVNANAACWLDYDRDGRVDLFLAGYWPEGVDLGNLKTTHVMPGSFAHADNGGRKYLLRNKGDGTFEDVTAQAGIKSTRWTLGVAAADLCGTGYPDLVLANDYGVSELYANRGDGTFEEVGEETGFGRPPKNSMNVSLGDVFNQGRLAIYVTNITEPGRLVQGNDLWTPVGSTPRGRPRYLNQAETLGVARGGWSWGGRFADLDNDGRLDLVVANGLVSADPERTYWQDYGKIAAGLDGGLHDASAWPAIGDRSLAGYQRPSIWLNRGGGFIDVASAVGVADPGDGRAVIAADLGNRGALDLAITTQGGPLRLYRGTVAADRDWVQFDLTGGARPGREGGFSNRGAIGARVHVFWRPGADGPPQQQVQVVTAGDGFASQGMARLHFGLGAHAHIDKVVITWPSGRTQTLPEPAVRVRHAIAEPGP